MSSNNLFHGAVDDFKKIVHHDRVSQRLNLTAFLEKADSEVHIVHISHVIKAYTLESLSYLKYITHNVQAKINFTLLKKKDKKVRAPIKLSCHWRWQLYILNT